MCTCAFLSPGSHVESLNDGFDAWYMEGKISLCFAATVFVSASPARSLWWQIGQCGQRSDSGIWPQWYTPRCVPGTACRVTTWLQHPQGQAATEQGTSLKTQPLIWCMHELCYLDTLTTQWMKQLNNDSEICNFCRGFIVAWHRS